MCVCHPFFKPRRQLSDLVARPIDVVSRQILRIRLYQPDLFLVNEDNVIGSSTDVDVLLHFVKTLNKLKTSQLSKYLLKKSITVLLCIRAVLSLHLNLPRNSKKKTLIHVLRTYESTIIRKELCHFIFLPSSFFLPCITKRNLISRPN